MEAPLLPDNEPERLEALRSLSILDTAAEPRFDRLTRLARHTFRVATALVSLVDADRQWFKSRQGLDACETGRDISFCGHAILGGDIFEVTDASSDPRFSDNPLVTGPPHIRFYAGAPLVAEGGYSLGTLCIIDGAPRTLTRDERQALRDLADCVQEELNQTALKRQKQTLENTQLLNRIIARAQSKFIHETERSKAFDELLTDVLALTDSEYGFIGEVLRTSENKPYLKAYALTNIAWNDETRALYAASQDTGLEFTNLDSLFGAALSSGQPVIANHPATDSRRGGLPDGHPSLDAFLGVPILHDGEMVAMLGLANRPGGYDQALVDFMQPLLATLGQLIQAARVRHQHREDQLELARLSRVASQTTNGVIITDPAGRIVWVNEGFTRITGYTFEDMLGQRPGDLLQGEATDAKTVSQMHEALSQSESFEVDIVNYAKSGRPYWVRISCNPMRDADGVLQGFMAIESDVTREKNDDEQIRASERRLTAVIEGTRIGTWEWNVQTGETLFNAYWAEIVGYTLDELGPTSIQTWMELAHPEDLEQSRLAIEQHFAGELDYYDVECRMRHKAGHWVWVHDRGRVVAWTSDRLPLLMSGTHADITEQKRAAEALHESELRLRALFELSPVGIALNDYETGAFLAVNDAMLAQTGYRREEFLGLHYWDLATPDSKAEGAPLDAMKKVARDTRHEKEYVRKGGARYPVLLNSMVVHERIGKTLIWSMVEDISERKRTERMKNEFVSTVSHELRTPLTSISGALGLIVGGALGVFPEQAQHMIAIAYKNSQRLAYLINDLLDMEKLMAGKMTFNLRRQPLMPLVEQAMRDNEAYFLQRQVGLEIRTRMDNVEVTVDGQRLQQVLANLLSNAAKFSPQGGTVEVALSLRAERVRVTVADHGPGIPAAFRDRIFEKFSQADSSDARQRGGTGLGLAITRELVERMGGEIGFESVEGEGACFYFDLPVCVASDNSGETK